MSATGPIGEDVSAWDPNALPPLRAGAGAGSADELVLLTTDSMRARRRPLAVIALWGWQTLVATFVALPVAAAVASAYGNHPSGDAPLWQPGGLALIDLVVGARGAGREALVLAVMTMLAAGFADLFPLAALIASIGYVTRDRHAPPLRAAFGRAGTAFTTFATLFAMASLVEAALLGTALAASALVSHATLTKLGEARSDQTGWLVGLVILGLCVVVGVLHDLARAGAIRFRVKALRAWGLAFNALARAPAAVLWSWAWRGLAGWVPVATAALVASRYGGRGGGPLVALFVVHQLVLIARVGFRASWLAAALRAVDSAHRVVGARRATAPNAASAEASY